MVSQWRVGLIGWGWAAGVHMAALGRIDDVEVVAVCTAKTDVDTDSLSTLHGRHIEVVRDPEDLLARDDIDVIDICSRSDRHTEQAVMAARAGKHVIIEKPISLSLGELRSLELAVAQAGVRTCVCFNERFSPQFTATQSLIEQGLIGPLHYGEVDYYHEIGPSVKQYEWNRRRVGICVMARRLWWWMQGHIPRVAQELLRHASGSNMTMARYAHVRATQQATLQSCCNRH
jgi:predicted dehydrogenase